MSALALPLQTSLAPRPDKPFDEKQKKNKDRDKRSDRQTGECDCKRHEKHGLNVEDQKDYGIEIILRVELNLRVADRFDAAFVGRSLVRTGLWRLEKSPPQPGQRQCANGTSGNISATPMKMMMKKYGCGFIQSASKFARK